MNLYLISEGRLFGELLQIALEGRGRSITRRMTEIELLAPIERPCLVLMHVASKAVDVLRENMLFLRRSYPGLRFVILCPEWMRAHISTALAHEEDVVLSDNVSLDALCGLLQLLEDGFAIEGQGSVQAATGPDRFTPAAPRSPEPSADQLLREGPFDPERFNLSKREVRIVALLQGGYSNREIAAKMSITEATVKVHLRSVFRKIGVRNRTQAAMWALNHISSPPP